MASFDHLKQICGPGELKDLFDAFVVESESLAHRLKQAVSEKDRNQAAMVAHQFKGLAASLNAPEMLNDAVKIESAVKESNWQSAHPLLEALLTSIAKTKDDFQKAVAEETQ